jgi:hypothetical protein
MVPRFAIILLNKRIRRAPSASFKFARISSLIIAETARKRATLSRQADAPSGVDQLRRYE